MDIERIKKGDILINPKTGFYGYATRIGRFVTLRALNGDEMTFDSAFLDPAPQDKVAEHAGKIRIDPDVQTGAPISQKAEHSPEEARSALEKFISDMATEHPDSAKNFKSFWAELMAALNDKPGKTWDMRWGSKDNFCPLLMAPSKRTNNWVIWAYLLGWEKVYIEMRTEYIPGEYLDLFPLTDRMRGTTRALKMYWPEFNAGPKTRFLQLIRAVSSKWQGASI